MCFRGRGGRWQECLPWQVDKLAVHACYALSPPSQAVNLTCPPLPAPAPAAVSYQHAFGFIRQLAVLLRSALTSKSKEAFREVYCWQVGSQGEGLLAVGEGREGLSRRVACQGQGTRCHPCWRPATLLTAAW